MTPRAWVRPIPESYVHATRGLLADDAAAIDLDAARAQHAQVVEGLRWLGFAIHELPPAHELPDSTFVEDPAVIVGHRALLTASAHPIRAKESPSVRAALSEGGFELVDQAQGTLDGGDVLSVGGRLFVSRSGRTDLFGIRALAAAFPDHPVVEVPLPAGVLHLKCVCSTPAPDTVVLAHDTVDPALFEGLTRVSVPAAEWYAANTVGRGGKVLIPAGFPGTRAALEAAGFTVRALDTTEIRKGDGSLTCLSLRSG